jgi:TolA-binding protein
MRRMRRNPSGDGKLFCVSLPGRGCYEWLLVKLISRLILYPLSLYFAIWCWGGFRDAYENMQLNRFSVELDGEEEKPVEVRGEETGSTDKGYDLGEDNRMLSNTPPARVEKKRPKKTEPPAKDGKTNQVENAGNTESPGKKGGIMTYFSGMLAALLVFALLVARDVSSLAGERVGGNYLTKSDKSRKADMYEEAESIWADGAYVDAIDSFREYLKVFPEEYHVHKRIAEIYEKDLGSFRAAAMEYEEMLEMNIPKTRWGWAAIHLCNLYSGKLDDTDRALAMLHRVASECADTTAGQKARDRLAKIAAG